VKSVLITGGSGTFGNAFVPSLLGEGVGRVCIYSRGEHRQAEMRAKYPNDERLHWFIGDVRDKDRLRRAMAGCDVVVHAAALKRIEVCEYDAIEMVKTNVSGVVNVIEAATDAGVKKVVGLSTDKACEPVNAYGIGKLLGERIFLAAQSSRGLKGPKFAVVRYGNIFGSAGSVVPRWQALMAEGHGEVPVTDPDCTRFFMRPREASQLVINTIRTMKGGDLVIPTWLPAFRLGDLAEAMGVDMNVIGLPEHEKRHESMTPGETSEDARRMLVAEIQGAVTEASRL